MEIRCFDRFCRSIKIYHGSGKLVAVLNRQRCLHVFLTAANLCHGLYDPARNTEAY